MSGIFKLLIVNIYFLMSLNVPSFSKFIEYTELKKKQYGQRTGWNEFINRLSLLSVGYPGTLGFFYIHMINYECLNVLLQVLESCVKNCGHGLHEEIATYRFMEDMKDLIKVSIILEIKGTIHNVSQILKLKYKHFKKHKVHTHMKASNIKCGNFIVT